MPLRRKKATKPKMKMTSKQTQNVRQSVKVVIEAPKPRRRGAPRPTKPTATDVLKGLMKAPEYYTFKDLSPATPSTGYASVPPPQPFKRDLHQIQINQQDNIGSVSGSISSVAGLLQGPKEEEKKSNEDAPEEFVAQVSEFNPRRDLTKEQMKLARAELAIIEREEKKAREKEEKKMREEADRLYQERLKKRQEQKAIEKEIELRKEQKADAFRRERLQRTAFGALKSNARPEIEIEGLDDF